MHLVMFDIDGTLVDTSAFEDDCFTRAITSVLDIEIDSDWISFEHVSDTGIVNELISDVKDQNHRKLIFQSIRSKFIEFVKVYLIANDAPEILGASQFIDYLTCREDVVFCFATGGWRPTAEMKLESAGLNHSGIAMASSDDHFDRTEIMKIAQERCGEKVFKSKTYFGDGAWDKKASSALGFNFILIGNKTTHCKHVEDFRDVETINSYIGL